MKKIYGIGAVIVIIIGVVLGYNFIYKVNPRDFISQDTVLIYALEEKMSEDNLKELGEIFKDMEIKYDSKDIQEAEKYISKFYIISDGDILTGHIYTAMVVDTGLWYPLVIKESSKYFDKDGEFFKLKSEYRDEVLKVRREIALAKEEKIEIYGTFYKGQIVLSENREFLKRITTKEKSYNSKIEEILNNNKNNPYGVLVYNNIKHRDIGIEALSLTYSIRKDIWDINLKVYGTEEKFLPFKEQPKERKLLKYLNSNQLYFSMKDFSKAEDFIFTPYILGGSKEGITMIWQGMFGISPEEMLKDIDGEIIIDTINQSAIIPFKNGDNAYKIAKVLKQFDDRIGLEDNRILIYGKNIFVENKEPYTVGAEEFLTADLDLYQMFKIPELQDVKGKIKGRGNEIDIDLFVTYDRIKENWKKNRAIKGF